MTAKANTQMYFITILKCSGVQLDNLVRCYNAPLLEYAAPVWHPGSEAGPQSVIASLQLK